METTDTGRRAAESAPTATPLHARRGAKLLFGKRARTAAATVLTACGLLAAAATPASAVANVRNNGPANVSAYAGVGAPEFGCYSNAITTAGVKAYALPGFPGQHIYAVVHLEYYNFNTGAWTLYNDSRVNFGLHPGGYQLNPGQSVVFPGGLVPIGSSGYYRGYLEIDWRTAGYAEIANVSARPSQQADYAGKYTYPGLYCAAGPWAA